MAFEDNEINEVIQEATRLPSTHRQGGFSGRDDFAKDLDGNLVRVPSPDSPESPLGSER